MRLKARTILPCMYLCRFCFCFWLCLGLACIDSVIVVPSFFLRLSGPCGFNFLTGGLQFNS